ncbi:MAG: TetR/AcrR family transcriptional regulator [Lachnospiraceae bacterium]|nr:TetR/AcrR family transcriptional regulator [Lachnospiraceae bacterium]MBP5702154.1 TetR/AcrR family transcriptional regulator [Lachnospiraceae bacterium]
MKKENDQGTRELLMEAAKKEFLEKGYNKASLRSICADAGLTTGALYFFFENKADLFAAIVDPPLNGLKKILFEHFREDAEEAKKLTSIEGLDMDHSEISDRIVGHIYENYDSFMLLLTSAENTVYENVVDEFVDMLDKSIPPMMANVGGYTYDEYMSHWMAHISMDAFIHVIKHEKDAETAGKRLRSILNYLVMGWVQLALVKK